MIRTERFIYFRMQKTASRYIGELFKYVFNSKSRVGGNHRRRRHVSNKGDKIFVSSVRNPWDWYVSFYFSNIKELNKGIKIRNRLVRFFYHDDKLLEFPDFIRNICSIDVGMNSLSRLDIGYYSYRFLDILARKKVSDFKYCNIDKALDFLDIDYFIRFEDTPDSIIGFLHDARIEYDNEKMEWFLKENKRYNKSKHEHYSKYYDDDLASLVAHKERIIINKFNYKYEESE